MTEEPSAMRALDFRRDGAQLLPGAALDVLDALEDGLAGLPNGKAGVRLYGVTDLADLLSLRSLVGRIAARLQGAASRPVRAVLFNKTAEKNWSLAWHQDRTIAVKERRDMPGFGPWTMKSGMHHVAPPFEVLAQMMTLRVHLDAVSPTNAPLLISPASHALGRIAESDIPQTVRQCGVIDCLADRGDVWLYATPILHASKRAQQPASRRVLQVDYSAADLPGGLEWLGL